MAARLGAAAATLPPVEQIEDAAGLVMHVFHFDLDAALELELTEFAAWSARADRLLKRIHG